MEEMKVWSLVWEDPLEKGMATHSNILTGKIPWTEEPGGLQSIGLQIVRHDLATKQQQSYIYLCVCVCMHAQSWSHAWLFATPWTIAHQAPSPWDSPGKNTKLGSLSLLQVIFLTQGSKPDLLHRRQILYHLSHQESPCMCMYIYIYIQTYILV